jgi:hypothetical protein
VIINYLNFKRIALTPNETNAILIIDSDTVLTPAISSQSLKMIPRKDRQITQSTRGM